MGIGIDTMNARLQWGGLEKKHCHHLNRKITAMMLVAAEQALILAAASTDSCATHSTNRIQIRKSPRAKALTVNVRSADSFQHQLAFLALIPLLA